jgi:putative DNA primase/helicase
MKENDADAWEMVNQWLLILRRHRIAVVIVHHAGRSGEMRGTSRREDNVFWIIALEDLRQAAGAEERKGAYFISRFTKPSRNTQDETPAYRWHFVTEKSGAVTVTCEVAEELEVFRKIIEEGVIKCGEIAEEMKVSSATVSRLAKRAQDAGWLRTNSHREYEIVESGTAATDGTGELL